MNVLKLRAALVAGAIFVVGVHTPAFAASPATQVFLDNLLPNVDFLDRSSRFAMTNSRNTRLKSFAFGEAKDQTLAANALDEWTESRTTIASAGPDQVVTGRSVALDERPPVVAYTRLPRGQEDLDSLEGLNGPAFDAEYRTKQLDALRQVETDYQDYLAKGDDPALLAIAKRELPMIRRHLTQLGQL